jgi:chromosome segregation ATPase
MHTIVLLAALTFGHTNGAEAKTLADRVEGVEKAIAQLSTTDSELKEQLAKAQQQVEALKAEQARLQEQALALDQAIRATSTVFMTAEKVEETREPMVPPRHELMRLPAR